MRYLALPAFVLLAACAGDETLHAYGAGGKTWALTTMNGLPYPAEATLEFPKPGQITGTAPCNQYSATQTVPYPWFKIGPIAATRMACAELPAEQAYFAALGAMTLSEVSGDLLILSNDAGQEMVFNQRQPAASPDP